MSIRTFNQLGRRVARHAPFLVVAVAMVATACTGSGTTAASRSDADLGAAWATEHTQATVERLGSADTALDALFLSLDAGFGTAQVHEGVTSETLQSDGSITGVEPANPPLGIILRTPSEGEGEGEGAYATDAVPEHLAFAQVPQVPLELLRERARENAGVLRASESEVGDQGVFMILDLIDSGFDAKDVIEMVILGIDAGVHREGMGSNDPDRYGIELPAGCGLAYRVVDEFICNNGVRLPVSPSADDQDDDYDDYGIDPSPGVPDADDTSDQPTPGIGDNDGIDGVYRGAVTADAALPPQSVLVNTITLEIGGGTVTALDGRLDVDIAEESYADDNGGFTTICGVVSRSSFSMNGPAVNTAANQFAVELEYTASLTPTTDCADEESFTFSETVQVTIDKDRATIVLLEELTAELERE